ncbi:MAG: hypothetical protein WC455_26845 [Dehalococcoidia bacterium]|jgi:hypothetical protein
MVTTARQFSQDVRQEFAVTERHIWDASREPEPVHEFAFGDPVKIPVGSELPPGDERNGKIGSYFCAVFGGYTGDPRRVWVLVARRQGDEPLVLFFDARHIRPSSKPAPMLIPEWVVADLERVAAQWREYGRGMAKRIAGYVATDAKWREWARMYGK